MSTSSSSDNESDHDDISQSRLGACEVCGANKAIYTCPKCEVKTCCLKCVILHKKELECDGVRDRTKFIRVKDFKDTDLLSDYRLLEECARFVYGLKRDEKKKFTRIDRDLPIHLYKLKMAARKRGTALQFLAQNFTRHYINTTRYNFKTNVIYWRIEWIFPNGETEPLKFVDEKCSECTKVSELLDKYLNPEISFDGSKSLSYYQSVGLSGVKILLRAEKVRGSSKKYFEIDPEESLAENLSGKCIVEFPIIFVLLKDHAFNLEVITPEDEFDYSEEKQNQNTEHNQNDNKLSDGNTAAGNMHKTENGEKVYLKRKRPLLTEKIAFEKKKEIEKEIKEERKKKPKNLLFTTGYSSEENMESDDSDNQV